MKAMLRFLLLILAIMVLLLLFIANCNPSKYLDDTMRISSVYSMASNSKNKAMLCTVIKDPRNRYITEWADYHMALGFSKIRIYDNSDNFTLEGWGWEKSYAKQIDRIHYIPGVTHNSTSFKECGAKAQSIGFMDCARAAKEGGYKWVTGLDIDEFLVIRDPYLSVVDLMDQYCKYPCGQLSFNWILFGPSNQTKYVPVPVTKRFTHRAKSSEWDVLVKGIADSTAIDLDKFWMHTWLMVNKTRTWMDTSGRILTYIPGRPLMMLMNPAKPTDVAVIHHYKTLSEGEWHEKNCVRKDLNGYNADKHCKAKAADILPENNGILIDDVAWQRLRMLVPGYEIYDDLNETLR